MGGGFRWVKGEGLIGSLPTTPGTHQGYPARRRWWVRGLGPPPHPCSLTTTAQPAARQIAPSTVVSPTRCSSDGCWLPPLRAVVSDFFSLAANWTTYLERCGLEAAVSSPPPSCISSRGKRIPVSLPVSLPGSAHRWLRGDSATQRSLTRHLSRLPAISAISACSQTVPPQLCLQPDSAARKHPVSPKTDVAA